MRRRIVLIMVVFILLTLTISCNQDNGKTLVREGVGRMEAIWKCMTEKEYYLMQYYFPNKSKEPGWRVLYGLFSREVCVEGHNPYYILGSDLLGYSWYLVKGHYVEDPSKKGEPYYFMEGIPYFHVDEWDVVAPVKRLHEELWESNIKGFDLDDVQKGEYLANIDQRRVSTGSDFIKMIQEKKIEGIFASAQVEDGEIQWFQLDDYYSENRKGEITVRGNAPQKYLSETFLHDENVFILTGTYDEETSTFFATDWGFGVLRRKYTKDQKIDWNYGNFYGHHAFDRDENGQLLHSRYYFDSLDIENGDYFPNGDSLLGRQDGLE